MKYLILNENSHEWLKYINAQMRCNNVDVFEPYIESKSRIINLVMKICLKILYWYCKIPLHYIFLNKKWKRQISNYDCVIIFNSVHCKWELAKYLNKKHNKKIVIWYNDTLKNSCNENKLEIKRMQYMSCLENIKVLSFDKQDCERFGLVYLNNFYAAYKDFKYNRPKKYDVYFCGEDRGRSEIIEKTKKVLKQQHVTYKFIICTTDIRQKNYHYGFLPYKEILDGVSYSNCICELMKKNQVGITMRTLEALAYSKKLITNNGEIINESYYNPQNIFVLGIDDINQLRTWISMPYVSINEDIIKQYLFQGWLDRISVL